MKKVSLVLKVWLVVVESEKKVMVFPRECEALNYAEAHAGAVVIESDRPAELDTIVCIPTKEAF